MSDNHEANMATVKMNPWNPELDPMVLRVVGKLGEETGELSSILGRITCQGFLECDPVTKKPNVYALEDELADVAAATELALRCMTDLSKLRFERRKAAKLAQYKEWFKLVRATPTAPK
jgi:hypothetical protein